MWDLAELIEERGWLTPTSATDKLYPYGIPYYINFLDNGSTTGGFNGKTVRYTNGTTGTIVAGIDGPWSRKWRNYADIYTKVDNSLLRKLRGRSPHPLPPGPERQARQGQGRLADQAVRERRRVVTELEDLADKRDDNNTPNDLAGKMLHNFDGTVYFNRMPVVYIPQLDGLTVTGGTAPASRPTRSTAWTGASFSPSCRTATGWRKASR
jgi:hypothetical protein